jgi:kynurenine formamidase
MANGYVNSDDGGDENFTLVGAPLRREGLGASPARVFALIN